MFLDFATFAERMVLERARRQPRQYELGEFYCLGGDNRITGKTLERDKVLGREVRMDVTATRPHIKREAHPDAVAAKERDASKADPRWVIRPKDASEFRCPLCGAAHPNPALAHTYRSCSRCSGTLTPPDLLHKEVTLERKASMEARALAMGGVMAAAEGWRPEPLHVLAASLGHPVDASKAVDVTAALRLRITDLGSGRSVVDIPRGTDLLGFLGVQPDPALGESKVLLVRYELVNPHSVDWGSTGTRAEVRCQVTALGVTQERVRFANPSRPALVKIGKAHFGHPLGGRQGRGAFDVSEALQGRVDGTDGAYLQITHSEDIYQLFDDPSPGMHKELVVDYELMGVGDTCQEDEMKDHVVRPLGAKIAPKFAPLILVQKATFGITREGAAERRKELQKVVYLINSAKSKKAQRVFVSPLEVEHLESEAAVMEELGALHPDSCKYGAVDVTATCQRLVDGAGDGKRLSIPANTDLRGVLGLGKVPEASEGEEEDPENPLSSAQRAAAESTTLSHCRFKQLRVKYTITGHDSEQRTSSEEVTSSGYDRNFIRYLEGLAVVTCQQKKRPNQSSDDDGEDGGSVGGKGSSRSGRGSVGKIRSSSANNGAGCDGSSGEGLSSEVVGGVGVGVDKKSITAATKRKKAAAASAEAMTVHAGPPPPLTRTPLDVAATTVFPVMKIEQAVYGHHTNPRRQMDVKSSLETLVEEQGRDHFMVARNMNLQKLFGVNPLRGYRKMLKVGYVARGLMGTLRVPDGGGHLTADLFVGYPPSTPMPGLPFENLDGDVSSLDGADGSLDAEASSVNSLTDADKEGLDKQRQLQEVALAHVARKQAEVEEARRQARFGAAKRESARQAKVEAQAKKVLQAQLKQRELVELRRQRLESAQQTQLEQQQQQQQQLEEGEKNEESGGGGGGEGLSSGGHWLKLEIGDDTGDNGGGNGDGGSVVALSAMSPLSVEEDDGDWGDDDDDSGVGGGGGGRSNGGGGVGDCSGGGHAKYKGAEVRKKGSEAAFVGGAAAPEDSAEDSGAVARTARAKALQVAEAERERKATAAAAAAEKLAEEANEGGSSEEDGDEEESRRRAPSPRRLRKSEGGLVQRRVVVVNSSVQALNGKKGVAVDFLASVDRYTVCLDLSAAAQAKEDARKQRKASREAKRRAKLEQEAIHGKNHGEDEDEEGGGSGSGGGGAGDNGGDDDDDEDDEEDDAKPPKHKYVRVVAAMLVDERSPHNEEAEEDPAAKAARLEKAKRKEERKKVKKAQRNTAGLLPLDSL